MPVSYTAAQIVDNVLRGIEQRAENRAAENIGSIERDLYPEIAAVDVPREDLLHILKSVYLQAYLDGSLDAVHFAASGAPAIDSKPRSGLVARLWHKCRPQSREDSHAAA